LQSQVNKGTWAVVCCTIVLLYQKLGFATNCNFRNI